MTSSIPEGNKSEKLSVYKIKKNFDKGKFTTRCLVTLGVLAVYNLLMSIPLTGVNLGEGDPFATLRIISASMHGSLAELGILPMVTAGLFMYILLKLNLYKLDPESQQERNRYNTLRVLLSILITIVMALLITISGIYGADLEFSNQILVIIQLTIVGVLISLLTEIIDRGWGLGSGISIFLAGSISLRITQGFIAPNNILEGPNDVTSARGIFIAFLYWVGEEGPISAIGNLFLRYSTNPSHNFNLPALSLLSVYLMGVFFVLAVFIETVYPKLKKQVTLEPSRKLGLTPVIPIVWTVTIFALIRFVSLFIWNTNGRENSTSILTWVFGQYRLEPTIAQYVPTGGLGYFVSPPPTLIDVLMFDPVSAIFHGIIYGALFLGVYMSFTKMMFQMAGVSTNSSQKIITDKRWLLLGIFFVVTDLLNLLAVGLGIILLALILVHYYQLLMHERTAGFVRFDLEIIDTPKDREIDRKPLTRDKYIFLILLIGLGQFMIRFLTFSILGREI
ncbi:MAG: hypothetical protein ACW97Z_12145 [Candidatus Hodarchaeales archaeon]|jgi:protein transport protein SEC61 subunit alpha